MNGEDAGWIVVVVIFCVMMITMCIVGHIATSTYYQNLLKEVGIERIEECHNVHSNWCEIVWIKK